MQYQHSSKGIAGIGRHDYWRLSEEETLTAKAYKRREQHGVGWQNHEIVAQGGQRTCYECYVAHPRSPARHGDPSHACYEPRQQNLQGRRKIHDQSCHRRQRVRRRLGRSSSNEKANTHDGKFRHAQYNESECGMEAEKGRRISPERDGC
jgi:hypothetical protein